MNRAYRVVIPTRDSAAWIGHVHEAYRRIGVEPLYIVDTRSSDGTSELLRSLKGDSIPFTPHGDIVEAGMIEFGAKAAGTEWVLRLDDDEFPSRRLLEWAAAVDLNSEGPVWCIPRKDIYSREGGFVYSQWPPRLVWVGDRFCLNPQERLFRVDAVRYTDTVHSPGFETQPPHQHAPEGCLFIHFNNIVRNLGQRLAKVRKYAILNEKAAWRYADECLTELTDSALHSFASDGLEEFAELLASLPSPKMHGGFELTERERTLFVQEMLGWFGESSRSMQEAMRHMQESSRQMPRHLEEKIRIEGEVFWLRFLPRPLMRPAAEALLTLGRLLNCRALSEAGARAWNFQKQSTA
ncbi:MAG: glycosyltransferase family 2 protein [Methylocystis sp.]